jgi:hypothetical protein
MVDMIYFQMTQGERQALAKELEIDLLVALGVTNSDDSRYARLRLATEYLWRHHDVGSVGSGEAYWLGSGNMPLRMAVLADAIEVVMFAGEEGGNLLGLFGMDHNIPGRRPSATVSAKGTLAGIMELQSKHFFKGSELNGEVTSLTFVEDLASEMPRNERATEFLAKTEQVQVRAGGADRRIILARPIYVAMAY